MGHGHDGHPSAGPTAILLWTAVCFFFGCAALMVPAVLLETPCDVDKTQHNAEVLFRAPFFVTGLLFLAHLLVLAVEWWTQKSGEHDDHGSEYTHAHADSKVVRNPLAIMESQDDPGRNHGHDGGKQDKVGRHVATRVASPVSIRGHPCSLAGLRFAFGRFLAVGPSGVLHLLSRLLLTFAYIYISSSTLAGLRGTLILFTALLGFAYNFRDSPGRRCNEWACVAICTLGAVVVGVGAEVAAEEYEYSAGYVQSAALGTLKPVQYTAIGIIMAVAGYFFFAVQLVVEEVLEQAEYSIYEVIGYQGAWGILIISAVLGSFQGMYNSGALVNSPAMPLDHPSDIMQCYATTPTVAILSAAYVVVCFIFYVSLFKLAAFVGPNYVAAIYTARSAPVYVANIIIYYAGQSTPLPGGDPQYGDTIGSAYGESVSPLSTVQFVGFALLIFGVLWRLRLQHLLSRTAADAACAEAALSAMEEALTAVQEDGSLLPGVAEACAAAGVARGGAVGAGARTADAMPAAAISQWGARASVSRGGGDGLELASLAAGAVPSAQQPTRMSLPALLLLAALPPAPTGSRPLSVQLLQAAAQQQQQSQQLQQRHLSAGHAEAASAAHARLQRSLSDAPPRMNEGVSARGQPLPPPPSPHRRSSQQLRRPPMAV